ncbi:MAG: TPM domain-containing protein [Spirochaetes bacterium]|nr:TPM domain-containing protein [Spirochaetota bacterium]
MNLDRVSRIARFLLLAAVVAIPALALDVPALTGRVNDYAGMISPGTVGSLEAKLAEFERQESTQIVILTIPSLEGDALEDFSIRVAEKWKIGQKKLDNGAILLITRDDRRLRIEVGYGLEGTLTDLRAGRIIDNIIKPYFRAGDYDRGVAEGVDAIMQTVRGEYSAADTPHDATRDADPWRYATPALIAFFFIGIIGKIKRLLGGIAGSMITPIAGGLIYGLSPWLFVLLPVGFLIGLIIPTLMTVFMMSGGGGMRTGGGFGGGFGGGGFSGGGGFGGGGASGSW